MHCESISESMWGKWNASSSKWKDTPVELITFCMSTCYSHADAHCALHSTPDMSVIRNKDRRRFTRYDVSRI